MKRSKQGGFTFIELMVVIVIIGMLSVAGIVSFRRASMSARNGKREADLSSIQQALQLYKVDTGAYPIYEQPGGSYNISALYDNYNQMQADLQSGSYLNQPINDPLYIPGMGGSDGNSRQYWYYSDSDGRTYALCYQKEPGLISWICKNNP